MPQTQTPTIYRSGDDVIDYTPGSAIYGGDVVVVGGIVMVSKHDIDLVTITKGSLAVEGIFEGPKDASVFAQGNPVYWNPTGNPTVGTAGTGCFTLTSAGNVFAGFAVLAQLTGDATVTLVLSATSGLAAKRLSVNTVAATGTDQTNAAALTEGLVKVTGADATKGVILPVGVPGARVVVKNDDAANAVLKVYPNTGAAINALTATTGAISMAAKTSAEFVALSATQWYTVPLVPS